MRVAANVGNPVPAMIDRWCTSDLVRLSADPAPVKAAISGLTASGETYIAPGLLWGWRVLSESDAGPFGDGRPVSTTKKRLILMTDGVATAGNTDIPSLCTTYRTGSNIVTHVITFGGEAASGTYHTSMVNAAANGNGLFFNAATAAQLQAAFQKIADSLPAVLIN